MNELIERIAADMQRGQAQQAAATQPVAEQRSALGAANYSWANPLAMRVKLNSYNAKNLPFSEAGIGLSNYGWNEDNIFQQLETARRNYRSGDKTGGHHDVYKYMLDQIGTFSDPKQAQLMKQFMETGNVPSGLTMDTVMQVSDYGLRANARKQQRKKKGFFSGNIGAIIGTIGGAIIGCLALPGVGCAAGAKMGAAAGGAAGGAGQAINEDRGLLGTALAAYSGYTMGATAGNIASAAATGAQQAGQQAATQAAIQSGEAAATEAARKAGESALISSLNIQQPLIGAAVNVGEQAARSTFGSLAAPFKAAASPVDTLGNLWNAATNPLQTFQSSGFYQGAVEPFVRAGKGVYGGIGSLRGPGFKAGFTAGSGGYFAPAYPGGPASFTMPNQSQDIQNKFFESQQPSLSSRQTPVYSDPVMAAPGRYNINYQNPISQTSGATVYPTATTLKDSPFATGFDLNEISDIGLTPQSGRGITYPGSVESIGSTVDAAQYLGGEGASIPVSATTGIGSLPTALYAKGAVKQILDPVTPEEYAEDKGFFTENNISRDMLDLDEAGAEEEAQLVDYGGTGVGQPAPFVPSDRLVASQRQLPDFERGALGRRVFGGDGVTLDNEFDLSPYFRSGFFKEGGAVDAGQYKGFPFMKQLPTNMQSKFQAYESGTQSIMDSSGERVEEGYTRVSGSDMEPVEERYVKTPMGVQEFFSRTPNGQFRLMA